MTSLLNHVEQLGSDSSSWQRKTTKTVCTIACASHADVPSRASCSTSKPGNAGAAVCSMCSAAAGARLVLVQLPGCSHGVCENCFGSWADANSDVLSATTSGNADDSASKGKGKGWSRAEIIKQEGASDSLSGDEARFQSLASRPSSSNGGTQPLVPAEPSAKLKLPDRIPACVVCKRNTPTRRCKNCGEVSYCSAKQCRKRRKECGCEFVLERRLVERRGKPTAVFSVHPHLHDLSAAMSAAGAALGTTLINAGRSPSGWLDSQGASNRGHARVDRGHGRRAHWQVAPHNPRSTSTGTSTGTSTDTTGSEGGSTSANISVLGPRPASGPATVLGYLNAQNLQDRDDGQAYGLANVNVVGESQSQSQDAMSSHANNGDSDDDANNNNNNSSNNSSNNGDNNGDNSSGGNGQHGNRSGQRGVGHQRQGRRIRNANTTPDPRKLRFRVSLGKRRKRKLTSSGFDRCSRAYLKAHDDFDEYVRANEPMGRGKCRRTCTAAHVHSVAVATPARARAGDGMMDDELSCAGGGEAADVDLLGSEAESGTVATEEQRTVTTDVQTAITMATADMA